MPGPPWHGFQEASKAVQADGLCNPLFAAQTKRSAFTASIPLPRLIKTHQEEFWAAETEASLVTPSGALKGWDIGCKAFSGY